MAQKLRITEMQNPLSMELDLASPEGIVRLMRQSDAQLGAGFGVEPGMLDDSMVRAFEDAARLISEALRSERGGLVVFVGAGTSGRLGYALASKLGRFAASVMPEKYRARSAFDFCIAGGLDALIAARENAEDVANQGLLDLGKAVGRAGGDVGEVVVVGISCGMSAAYVAGALSAAMLSEGVLEEGDGVTMPVELRGCDRVRGICLGFNPVDLVKDQELDGWPIRFLDVVKAMVKSESSVLLNPVVGPEVVAGSTRMKGGSATRIVLESVCWLGVRGSMEDGEMKRWIRDACLAANDIYLSGEQLAKGAQICGQVLRKGQGILYIGSGAAGLTAVIDASECPPTYGAAFEDVRACFLDADEEHFLEEYILREDEKVSKDAPPTIDSFLGEDDSITPPPKKDTPPSQNYAWYRRCSPVMAVDESVRKIGVAVIVDVGGEREVMERGMEIVREGGYEKVIVVGVEKEYFGWWESKIERDWLFVPILVAPVSERTQLELAPLSFREGPFVPGDVLRSKGVTASHLISLHAEIGLKLALNFLSTAAHVMHGTVWTNRMINLAVTNSKLVDRAARLISSLASLSHHRSLLILSRTVQRIANPDSDPDDHLPVSNIVSLAANATKHGHRVVPVALLVAIAESRQTPIDVADARTALDAAPSVRAALLSSLN